MKKGLALFVAFLASAFLIGATSWAAGLVTTAPSSTPTTLKPIPLKPAVIVPSGTLSTDAQTSFLATDDFSAVVDAVFKDARFTANSCGGEAGSRKTVYSIPSLWFREEGMERLEYDLTSNEKDQTKYALGGYDFRVRAIRSCFKYWRSLIWGGMVANGKFVLVIQLVTDPEITAVIEDRAIREMRSGWSLGVWTDDWNWGDAQADSWLQDYRFSGIRLEIRLTPAVVNGAIGYSAAEAVWVINGQGFDNLPSNFRDNLINALRIKIVDYKDRWLEAIRIRVITPIGSPEVQTKLSLAITEKFRAKHGVTGPIKAITGVVGNGNNVTVQHN
jgi:hypothetical protein